MLDIIFLVIGIIAFVKRKVAVSKTRELRGGPLYAVATLFCLPFPLAFIVGFVSAASNVPINTGVLIAVTWLPIIAGFIIAFTMAKPIEVVPVESRGFDVQPPPPPPQA